MMKKTRIFLMLAVCSLFFYCTGTGAQEQATEQDFGLNAEVNEILCADVTFFIKDLETEYVLPLYFLPDALDLPYVEVIDLMRFIKKYASVCMEEDGYHMTVTEDDKLVSCERENGAVMLLDFEEGTITFSDYDAFAQKSNDEPLLDVCGVDEFNPEGGRYMLQTRPEDRVERHGKEITLDLTSYGIDMFCSPEEGQYYIPLQVAADFLISYDDTFLLFNGHEGLVIPYADLKVGDEIAEAVLRYYAAPAAEKSERLADFSYRELCLALDNLYGQKESHDITDFNSFFEEAGLADELKSTDSIISDKALEKAIYYFLDDQHTVFNSHSPLGETYEYMQDRGFSTRTFDQNKELFRTAKENAPREIVDYEEVGNTAFVTFNGFYEDPGRNIYEADLLQENADEEKSGQGDEHPYYDTFSFIAWVHAQITRENSPVENVVLDLSMNTGGELGAAAYVTAWMLGECTVNVKSTLTGASSSVLYTADVNLDKKTDEKDTVSDRNLFCLISPVSFSAANTVASALKASGRVTMLGGRTCGGSSAVTSMSTAYGSLFQLSSTFRMSTVKNGSFYDIDQGVEPDYLIMDPDHFYDRDALAEYINQLY